MDEKEEKPEEPKPQPAVGMLIIDDSKVFVIPASKLNEPLGGDS